MDKIVTALKSLINDIEGMRCVPQYQDDDDTWFGPFSESEDCGDDGQSIAWPNLEISVQDAKQALVEYESNLIVLTADEITIESSENMICPACNEPQAYTPSGLVCKNGHGF